MTDPIADRPRNFEEIGTPKTVENIKNIPPKTTITKSYSIHVLGISNDIVTRY